MKFTMRWWGPQDRIPLNYFAQVPGVTGIVAANFDIEVGEIWKESDFQNLSDLVASSGLSAEVIESIPLHEDIKIGGPLRDQMIENYQQSIRNMGKVGIPVLCYNFMPIFDWMRTDLYFPLPDGSTTLKYDQLAVDTTSLEGGLTRLPAWANDFDGPAMNALAQQYRELGQVGLFENLEYFLKAILPVAEESGVKLALHPDDPPWDMFGIPRIVGSLEQILAVLSISDSWANGMTFCTGSLGCKPENDLAEILTAIISRTHFVHARNVQSYGHQSFIETAHPSRYGDVNMAQIIKILVANNFEGPIRSDHGRFVFGEAGTPGYGLYDRALGTTYLYGLYEATLAQSGGSYD